MPAGDYKYPGGFDEDRAMGYLTSKICKLPGGTKRPTLDYAEKAVEKFDFKNGKMSQEEADAIFDKAIKEHPIPR